MLTLFLLFLLFQLGILKKYNGKEKLNNWSINTKLPNRGQETIPRLVWKMITLDNWIEKHY